LLVWEDLFHANVDLRPQLACGIAALQLDLRQVGCRLRLRCLAGQRSGRSLRAIGSLLSTAGLGLQTVGALLGLLNIPACLLQLKLLPGGF